MLKTLFSSKVEDICPNCGKVCATTDVLCPSCGKNLDELFEQLPNPGTSSFTIPKWMIFPMKAKTSRAWRILNSLILMSALLAPWKFVYSDAGLFKAHTIIGLEVVLSSIPSDLYDLFSFDCLYCMGDGLIAIGYLSITIYTVLNFLQANLHESSHRQNLRKALSFFVIASGLFFLQIVFPMFMTVLAWGYWLACVGLISSIGLETTELISSKSSVDKAMLKAA